MEDVSQIPCRWGIQCSKEICFYDHSAPQSAARPAAHPARPVAQSAARPAAHPARPAQSAAPVSDQDQIAILKMQLADAIEQRQDVRTELADRKDEIRILKDKMRIMEKSLEFHVGAFRQAEEYIAKIAGANNDFRLKM
jgi:hypothetical protein